MLSAQDGNLSPHQCAVDQIVGKSHEAFVIAGELEITIQEPMAEVAIAARIQIHDQKRHFTHHIDPAQFGIEFNAIKRRDIPVDDRQVAQVQITVAFPDKALVFSVREEPLQLLPLFMCPVLNTF